MKLLAVLTSCVVAVSAKWPHPRQGQEHVDNVPASFDCAMRKVSSVSACTVTLYSVLVLFFFPFLSRRCETSGVCYAYTMLPCLWIVGHTGFSLGPCFDSFPCGSIFSLLFAPIFSSPSPTRPPPCPDCICLRQAARPFAGQVRVPLLCT